MIIVDSLIMVIGVKQNEYIDSEGRYHINPKEIQSYLQTSVFQKIASLLGMGARDMPSIVLTKDEHRAFTEAWRDLISYDNYNVKLKTSTASKEDILNAAAEVYQDYPELLKTIKEIFK